MKRVVEANFEKGISTLNIPVKNDELPNSSKIKPKAMFVKETSFLKNIARERSKRRYRRFS